jgi:preprotein translocase SecE subunit
MAFAMYKPDQGYWTRMSTAIAAGVLVASAAAWAWGQLSVINTPFAVQYLQGGVAMVILAVGLAFVYWLCYVKPKSSEFLIATEGEMKKVNWSSRREILGSTWVVITVALVIAVMIFVVDWGFSTFFRAIDVLKSG